MEDDDKEITEDELKSLHPTNLLGNLKHEECEPDVEALAKLDALDARDDFERFLSGERASVMPNFELPAPASPTPVKPEMPLEAATEPAEVGLSGAETDTKVRLRIPGKIMGALHPALAEHIAKWRAKDLAQTEERRRLATKRRHETEERRRPEMPSTRRNWQFRADAAKTIEVPDPKIVEPDIKLAPGCFGLAMTFSIDAKECVPCPFRERCMPLAAQNLIALRNEREVDSEFHKEFDERKAHDRARNRKAKAKSRLKLDPKAPADPHPIVAIELTLAALAERKAKLVKWLAEEGPRQRQHRKHQKEILADYTIFQYARRRMSGDPGPTAFAQVLTNQTGRTVTISSAQKRLARLCRLESAEGPWFDPKAIVPA